MPGRSRPKGRRPSGRHSVDTTSLVFVGSVRVKLGTLIKSIVQNPIQGKANIDFVRRQFESANFGPVLPVPDQPPNNPGGRNRNDPNIVAARFDLQFVEQFTLEHIILGDDLSTSMQDSTGLTAGSQVRLRGGGEEGDVVTNHWNHGVADDDSLSALSVSGASTTPSHSLLQGSLVDTNAPHATIDVMR